MSSSDGTSKKNPSKPSSKKAKSLANEDIVTTRQVGRRHAMSVIGAGLLAARSGQAVKAAWLAGCAERQTPLTGLHLHVNELDALADLHARVGRTTDDALRAEVERTLAPLSWPQVVATVREHWPTLAPDAT